NSRNKVVLRLATMAANSRFWVGRYCHVRQRQVTDPTVVHRIETKFSLFLWEPEGGQLRFCGNHSGQLRAAMTGATNAVAWLEVQTSCAEIVGISGAIHD